jgi:hypothetical protein
MSTNWDKDFFAFGEPEQIEDFKRRVVDLPFVPTDSPDDRVFHVVSFTSPACARDHVHIQAYRASHGCNGPAALTNLVAQFPQLRFYRSPVGSAHIDLLHACSNQRRLP